MFMCKHQPPAQRGKGMKNVWGTGKAEPLAKSARVLSIMLFTCLLISGTQECVAVDYSFADCAISLKVLQERARECVAKGQCHEDILTMCGVKKLHGYILAGC